jgi:O-antigen ligase
MWWALTPEEGLVAEQQGRAGQAGSGRVADFRPGIDRWLEKPIVGHGLGLGRTTGGPPTALEDNDERRRVIYDNQWLQVLISLGAVGLIGALWFVWGAVIKLIRAARRTAGEASDLMAAVAVSCAGYGVGMITYDSFAFVQVTLLFFVITALGLRARTLQRT